MQRSLKGLILASIVALFCIWTPAITADQTENPGVRINSLLECGTLQPLLEHHLSLLQNNDIDTVARELMTLTHGMAWQMDPVVYISEYEQQPNGDKHFKHALWLGHWLGSLQLAIDEQDFSKSEAASWFSTLLENTEQLISPGSSSQSDENQPAFRATKSYQGLSQDIANGRITLGEAVELLAYGDITSSSITTVIGQGIRAVERRTAR